MIRLFFTLLLTGVAANSAGDAALHGDWWFVLAFVVGGSILGGIGWFTLKALYEKQEAANNAEERINFLLSQASSYARDAANYADALIAVRELMDGEDNECCKSALGWINRSLSGLRGDEDAIRSCFRWMAAILHNANKHWWIEPKTGENLRNARYIVPTKLMLTVTELSEAMEAHRKNLKDDKLPHYDGLTVELADALIRIFDLAGAKFLDVGAAAAEKMAYNATRLDHQATARLSENGKRY